MSGDLRLVFESTSLLPVNDIILSGDSHLNSDLSLLARSAAQEFSTLFSVEPPAGRRPVSILYNDRPNAKPFTDSVTDTTRYKVFLTVMHWYPELLIYELGHELCHIFADPRRANWFVESCCAMASTVLLYRMSEVWPDNPLPVGRRTPKFQQYAQERIVDAQQAHPPDHRQAWLLNAEILRPLFKESLQTWNALCSLGQASTCPPRDLMDWNEKQRGFSFDRWLEAIPDHHKDIVKRISNIPQDRWNHPF